MKVLIGITSKNRKTLLPKAITSAIEQKQPAIKVAVYDDNSTDGTQDLATLFPMVEWHLADDEKGYLYARNLLMSTTSAEYYCSLDDDSWFLSDTDLQRAVTYMDNHKDCGVVGFRILTPDGPSASLDLNDSAANRGYYFVGCGHLVRIEAARQVGFYTQNPGYYGGEEKDLSIKLIDRGYYVDYVPSITVWHEKTPTARNLLKQHQSGVCNDLVFVYRRVPATLLPVVLIYKIYSHLKFALLAKKGLFFSSFIKGYIDFFRFLFKNNTDRKPVKYSTYRLFIKFSRHRAQVIKQK